MGERTRFVCQGCGYASPKWLGRCGGCGAFATLVEERGEPRAGSPAGGGGAARPQPLDEIALDDVPRLLTGCAELDRVLGGGLVPGSVVLLGGDPGVGKSTLLLEYLGRLAAARDVPVLYCSGEESPRQIRMRAERLGLATGRLSVLCTSEVEAIVAEARRARPAAVVVDSIQTVTAAALESTAGSISQVREAAAQLIAYAKRSDVPVVLVGHVTKDGTLAGPRVLEHMVDTVLYFEGETARDFRILRAVKNRFGSTDEIGVFAMGGAGLEEVANPSRLFLGDSRPGLPGSVAAASVEGTRPFLVEVQALCAPSGGGSPRRVCSGADPARLAMLVAILEKKLGLVLSDQDVYVNLAGGIRVVEPAVDLAVLLALWSSFRGVPFDAGTAVFGEVGLTGEVRAVANPEARAREAAKLGFRRCIVPAASLSRLAAADPGIETAGIAGVDGAIEVAFL